MFHLGAETGVEFAGEGVVVERHGDLHVAEDGIVGEHVFEVDRNDGREPTVAMHDGRVPAQFLDRFEHAAREEDGALVVVGEPPCIVGKHRLAREIVVVVDLHAGGRDRRHLDDELMVVIVDDQVHARKPDHLVKLVPPFVDATVTRHERPDLVSPLLHRLHQLPAQRGLLGLRKVGENLLTNV